MRISLSITDFSWPGGPPTLGSDLARIATLAEQAGVDVLWVSDHLLQAAPGSAEDGSMLEAYTTLGFLAARTERIALGTMVTAATFRPPALLVKAVTTLDVLSGGRAWLGIGAGYHDEEARAFGLSLPPLRERFERLEETLALAQQMWAGDAAPFEGKHLRLERPVGSPRPLSRPHPPILIGGMGERKTLRLVAQYADACNLFAYGGPDVIRQKLGVLRGHCEDVGRDYEEIERTALSTVNLAPDGMTSEEVIGLCSTLNEAGIDHLILNMPNVHEIRPLETFGEEIIPTVAGL
jgi:F420-dependent oxidoreductase-like protein